MTWYYEQGGQRQGPVTDTELDRLVAEGTVTSSTLVWREGMDNWTPLAQARPASGGRTAAMGETPPEGWVRCTATGRYFPPSEIVYIDGKPYSAASKAAVVQGVMQSGELPVTDELARTGPPWEHREELGIFKSGWETIKGVLMNPSLLFAGMRREGGIGGPLLFAVIFGSIGSIIGLIYQFAFDLGSNSFLPAGAQPDPNVAAAAFKLTTGAMIGLAITMPALIALGSFIGAGVLHVALMICGGAKQPFETTFRTYCYVQGASSMLQIVPMCGAIASGLWALISLCIGLSKTQEISVGRAVCAVLLPTVICCGLVFAGAVAVAAAVAAAQ